MIEPLLPKTHPGLGGRPPVHSRRLIIDTISYVLVSGCAWRLVPHDLAPWNAAYQVFAAWTADGTWARIHDVLRDQVREWDGRDPQPSAAVLDSQSVKSSEGGEEIGYDAGKRVRGRKRHLLVDTLGLLLVGIVHSASVQDRDAPMEGTRGFTGDLQERDMNRARAVDVTFPLITAASPLATRTRRHARGTTPSSTPAPPTRPPGAADPDDQLGRYTAPLTTTTEYGSRGSCTRGSVTGARRVRSERPNDTDAPHCATST